MVSAMKMVSKDKKTGVQYCPTHKSIRMKAQYLRGTRTDGQPFIPFGYICPVCKYQEIDPNVLTGV